ncbi:MAG TPA: hypothetical protein VF179_01770 [Thermoanaerobaculia bacterium]|nr:hypothetical protein [Thermoanaerobaculia bacterium]
MPLRPVRRLGDVLLRPAQRLEDVSLRSPQEEDRRRPFVCVRELAANLQAPFGNRRIQRVARQEPVIESAAERAGSFVANGELHGDHRRETDAQERGCHPSEGARRSCPCRLTCVEDRQAQGVDIPKVVGQQSAADGCRGSLSILEVQHPFMAIPAEGTVPQKVKDMEPPREELPAQPLQSRRLKRHHFEPLAGEILESADLALHVR